MAETIVQITAGNLYVKTGSAQDALLILAAAENYIMTSDNILEAVKLEAASYMGQGGPEEIKVELNAREVAESIIEQMMDIAEDYDEEEEGE